MLQQMLDEPVWVGQAVLNPNTRMPDLFIDKELSGVAGECSDEVNTHEY